MKRPFRDRRDAGRFLAEKLSAYANRPDVIVLALPRGGVPVAYEVARALNAIDEKSATARFVLVLRAAANIRKTCRPDNSTTSARRVVRRRSLDARSRARVCWRDGLASCRSKV
jgi:hypothetical protein